jgi:hypothetical protein
MAEHNEKQAADARSSSTPRSSVSITLDSQLKVALTPSCVHVYGDYSSSSTRLPGQYSVVSRQR